MHFPLISKDVLSDLRVAHGLYNLIVVLLFFYQGSLGFRIRRARKAHRPLPFPAIRRHRRGGPFLAGSAVFGFLFGLVLILLDTGNILEYPAHFLVGCLLVLAIILTVFLSNRIKGQQSPYRDRHFAIGVLILCTYPVQVFLGLGALL